jgi:hypothetical protein
VALPSQEGKKGAMQYALYVHSSAIFQSGDLASCRMSESSPPLILKLAAPRWIKSPTGLDKAHSGP